MNIKSCEKKEKSTVEIIVEVDRDELDAAMNNAFRKNRNSISVPGFRRGKAPRKIVEKLYGEAVFRGDAIEELFPKVMSFAIKECEHKIVSMPTAEDVDFKDGSEGADITLIAAIYPEVALGDYKGLSAVKPAADVPDSAVDSELAGIQLRNARIETAGRPAINGDTAVIDYEGFVDGEAFEGGKGENHELKLGSNSFIPGFEEKLHGMVTGEERDIDLVFPENYVEHLAGKPVVFKVKLNELREQILPDLDDELAKDVSEFDTLEDYKNSIREGLLKANQEQSDAAFENALLEKLIETLEADIPDQMIEAQLDNGMNTFAAQISAYGMDPMAYLQMMNTTPEEFREKMRGNSEKQVKVTLALNKIAELEGIEASAEDIEKEYAESAERYGSDVDDMKERFNEDDIAMEIKMRLATKIVVDNAIALDPPDPDEAAEAEKDAADADKEAPAAAKPKKAATKKAAAGEPAGKKQAAKPKEPAAKKATAKAASAEPAATEGAAEQAEAAQEPPKKKKPAAKAKEE
ncbi:MAG: trigger factor [Oscillospiraceae bacterium]|nr:trigger factor [Oscillospiraceae bacterium]